ncbi:MAG: MbnP family protein [Bacteroidota bacterium]
MRFVVFLIVYLYACCLCSQTYKKYDVVLLPMYGQFELQPDLYYKSGNDSLMIETLKFYISGIKLIDKGKVVWIEPYSFHLVDMSELKTLCLHLTIPSSVFYDQLKFNLGIDSVTNVAGAMGGDLDPTKGMYWTWQSGYINFKLEGKSNVCKTRNNEFQLHLGGYKDPFYNLKTLTLNVSYAEKTNIILDIEQVLKTIDLSKQNHIMSPGPESILLSEKVVKSVYTQKVEK